MYIIDRIEDDWAVIETDDRQTFYVSLSLIPRAKEGDVINISVVVDQDDTKARQRRIKGMMNNFFEE